ncbi:nuclear RNA export factor 2-like [Pipistrellus kuhlii]|uniref:nuclear RNA export factor 2-like n=1 Tax=Pipistrellus kuhlii TaxID=59472 RepID=UPI00174F211C|nr:nuclear RNA export factor 2-like [Pipistrellus kuhlii]
MVHEDDDGNAPQERKKSWNSLRRHNFGNKTHRYQHGGYELQPPHLLKDDGNMEMRGVQRYPVRQSEVEKKIEAQTLRSWFKVTIPYGRKYDRTWLMDSIQNHCSVPFTPVDFHYVQNKARFFVQDACTASALEDVSNKIYDEENQKVCIAISVSTSDVPYSVRDKLEPEIMEQLELAMYKRYDVSQKALDLQWLRYDSDLVDHGVDIILNRRNCMAATLQIIAMDFPELLSLNLNNNRLCQLDGLSDIVQMVPTVKILNLSKNELNSTWELCKIKGLQLEDLWLEDNPLCSTFPDQSTYISAIRTCFPKLLRLDGHDLYPPIIIDIDRPYLIKPLIKDNYKGSDALKNQVLHFLQQYYFIYDFGDRRNLLSAYHNEACFSLTVPYIPDNPAPYSLFQYFKNNRNLRNLQDPNPSAYPPCQLLKYTKHDIVSTLCMFPKTQHDLNSFIVNIWFQSESILLFFFRVHGIFKEGEGEFQNSMCAFTRTCIATPANNFSLCIINEELFVRDITPNKTQNAFSTQVPTPPFITGPTFSQERQRMEQVFSTPSGMSF